MKFLADHSTSGQSVDRGLLSAIDLRVVSINAAHTGVLNPYFFDYDSDLNRWLVHYCVRHTPQMKDLPDELLEAFTRYPEMTQSE